MLLSREDAETLMHLGLTERQAKVYLALLQTGLSRVEDISRASLVHRQEVYRVVESLEKMGLVDIEVNTPIMYKPIPLKEALKILFQHKAESWHEIREKSKILIEKFDNKTIQVELPLGKSYHTISENDRGRNFKRALNDANEDIDIVTTTKKLNTLLYKFEDSIRKALMRGVTFRVITQEPENEPFAQWSMREVMAQPNFKLKIIPNISPAIIAIFDQTEVSIGINIMMDATNESYLWSNDNNLIILCKKYFHSIWE